MTEKLEIKTVNGKYLLLIDDVQYMCFDPKTQKQYYELVNHNTFAYGHVITTGLGYGIRERMLLSNPNVKKITILEKHKTVINLNRKLLENDKIEVIHCDANEYVGDCDVLLIDHYADGQWSLNFNLWRSVAENVQNNIKSKLTWVWPIEYYLTRIQNPLDLYEDLRNKLNLPELTEDLLKKVIYLTEPAWQLKQI